MMKSGRELDALIAKRFLGWSKVQKIPYCGLVGDPLNLNQLLAVPHYSTDLRAAWEVLEEIKSKLKGEIAISCVNHNMWEIFPNWHTDGQSLAEAETMPLAICLAALKLVGTL